MPQITIENTIRSLVRTAVETYATTFSGRHISELKDPEGTLNMKIHNIFIAALGEEIQYFTALVRSLDSSLGNMLETLAINIARLFYEVERSVEGPLSPEQTQIIAKLLEEYKSRAKKPEIKDYQILRNAQQFKKGDKKRHDSDYYLIDKTNGSHYLIELKIGGDLDNKKARSEKEALLEQFAILSNILHLNTDIKCFFATGYNRYGEDKEWKQERVKQFFANDELLIGKDFWNFICKSNKGYDIICSELYKHLYLISNTFNSILPKLELAA
jgi:hypothetical protein